MNNRKTIWHCLAKTGFLVGATCRLCGCRSLKAVCDSCNRDLRQPRHVCQRCATRLAETSDHCGQCLHVDYSYDALTAPFDYSFPLDVLLSRFKYQPDLALLPALRVMLRAVEHKLPCGIQALLPVPLHNSRQRLRGFNQATLIAKAISHFVGVPVAAGLAQRQRKTAAQATLSRDERGPNVAGAFVADRAVFGTHLCIVDDVVTTGATLNALAHELKLAGAASVIAFAVAKAA